MEAHLEENIMIKQNLTLFIILVAILGLSACGEKKTVEEPEAVPEVTTPEVVPGEMVLIPAGEFLMGSNEDKDNIAYPEHKVDLPAYWIDKYEVTNKEFLEFSVETGYMGEGVKEGQDWRLFATIDKILHPVVYITWNDAAEYCKWRGKRLPTEEEWEKAARGPDGNRYPWGNEWEANRSNTYESGMNSFMPVGQFDDVSYYGVHDMLGNAQEWTGSWYVTYKGNPKRDSKSGKQLRVVRGLSYLYKGKVGSLTNRSAQPPNVLYDFTCRCAKDATPEDIANAGQTE
jgi:formylglycine-generating enzyme required for sulfatase activity